ncbi:PR-1-like protein [Coprinopsis sp. MPI-PUGE-AT-0042]|nr:PR-1-like protein [Coprinopsis sp. MPI-PUGE-AT-0042]
MACFPTLFALLVTVASTFVVGEPVDSRHTLERRTSQEWLDAHNTVRAEYGANPLTWDKDLETAAQNWAQRCVFEHSKGKVGPYGENLAAGTGSFPISNAVKSWAHEVVEYSAEDPENPKTLHWTQLVWKSTTRLGCATVTCDPFIFGNQPARYHVCEYNPPGNYAGQFDENVQDPYSSWQR